MVDGTSNPDNSPVGSEESNEVSGSRTSANESWLQKLQSAAKGVLHKRSAEQTLRSVGLAQQGGQTGIQELAQVNKPEPFGIDDVSRLTMQLGEEAHIGYQLPSIPVEQTTPEALSRYGMQLKDLNHSLAELLRNRKEDATYDEFYERVISQYPAELVPYILRGYQEQSIEIGPGGIDTATVQVIADHVTQDLGRQYLSLLVDPGIGMGNRPIQFLATAKDILAREPGLSPLELRKRFIATFETKTYYRAKITQDNQPQRGLTHVSGLIEAVLTGREVRSAPPFTEDEHQEVGGIKYDREIDRILHLNESNENKFIKLAVRGVPFFGSRLRASLATHVGGGFTKNSAFLSISEHPEIAYYATADEGEESWKQWNEHQGVAISQFEMNSFYAIDRMSMFSGITNGEYNIGGIKLPVNARGIELLVPFGLPKTYTENQRIYKPPFDSPDKIPKASDWR